MRSVLLRAFLSGLALQATAAATCGLPQPRLVCQEYFASPVVVVAKLVRIRRMEPTPGQLTGTYYYMEAVQRRKGRILNRFQVYEENSSGRAQFEWKRGEDYLLFLTRSGQSRDWEFDGCGNSAPMSKAQKVLDEIGRMKTAQERQMIAGSIASDETLPARLMVKVEGEGKTRTVAVENREFRLRVEPGTYVVTASYPGWQFRKDDFSYDDPQKIAIEPGRCAQVQFQAEKSPAANRRPALTPASMSLASHVAHLIGPPG